jgi:hypothetical protein
MRKARYIETAKLVPFSSAAAPAVTPVLTHPTAALPYALSQSCVA